VVSQMMI